MLSDEQINTRFEYHAPKGNQAERYEANRANFATLAKLLRDNCPESRELSVAMTNLEQAMFWANAAIARNE